MEIVEYVASEEGFFDTPCCIDCSVEKYCVFTDADRVLEVDRVYDKNMVDVGEGILISEPTVVERGLRMEGDYFYASLSHQGILAICSTTIDDFHNHYYDQGYGTNIIQFTNLKNGEQAEMGAKDDSNIAFYDNKMILLTSGRPLREARVEEVFNEHDLSVFKRIGDVDEVDYCADTSILHSRRILCYTSTQHIPYEYDVDTKENKRIEIGQKVWMFSSLMGINCGVKYVFQDYDNRYTYALDWDNKITPLHEAKEWALTSLFVSSAHPKDISKSVLKYDDYFIKGGNKIYFKEPIHFKCNQSVIRVYKDIFLLHDKNTKKWILSRILVS